MQFGVTFLVNVLLCFFICTCKGTPPEQQKCGTKYTEIEDNFIIDELSQLLDGRTPALKRDVWQKIAEKHREKRKLDKEGFPQVRSSSSLRGRFRNTILQKQPSSTVEVPETLLRKIRQAQSHILEQGRTYKVGYTEEENNFIIEELRKPEITRLYGKTTFEAIREAHERKRLAETEGFVNERTVQGIRNQLLRLKETGRLPKEVLEKLKMLQHEETSIPDSRTETNHPDVTGASSSTSLVQNQETDVQTADIYQSILEDPIVSSNYSVNESAVTSTFPTKED